MHCGKQHELRGERLCREAASRQDLPIPIGRSCDGRTLVSLNQSAELGVSADITLILAFCEGSDQTIDKFWLVARESKTTACSFWLVVDVFDERFCLSYGESSYCFHEQLRECVMVKVEAKRSQSQYVVRKKRRQNDRSRCGNTYSMVSKAARRGIGGGHSLKTSIHLRVSRLSLDQVEVGEEKMMFRSCKRTERCTLCGYDGCLRVYTQHRMVSGVRSGVSKVRSDRGRRSGGRVERKERVDEQQIAS